MVTKRFILLVIFYLNISLVLAQENEWALKKDKQGIKIYTREDESTGIIEFQASSIIETTIDTLLNVFHNVNDYNNWMADTKSSYVLTKINENEYYIYLEARLPWPFENRDMPLYQKITRAEDGIIISMLGKPDYIPQKEGITRIEKAKGSWEFISQQENKVEVTYTFLANPGLNIPNWIINLFIVDGPYKTLLNLKEIVEY